MKPRKLIHPLAVLLWSVAALSVAPFRAAAAAVDLDLTGMLYTQTSIVEAPVSLSYDADQAVPWLEAGYTLATPLHGLTALSLDLNGRTYDMTTDAQFPDWPGLVLKDGAPYSVDFVVLNPVPGVFRLGASGIITDGRVQLFVGLFDEPSPVGLAGSPVSTATMQAFAPVPEPRAYGILGLLIGAAFVAVRRYRPPQRE